MRAIQIKATIQRLNIDIRLFISFLPFDAVIFNAGSVDLEELILAFKELGIDIDKAEATKLLER